MNSAANSPSRIALARILRLSAVMSFVSSGDVAQGIAEEREEEADRPEDREPGSARVRRQPGPDLGRQDREQAGLQRNLTQHLHDVRERRHLLSRTRP